MSISNEAVAELIRSGIPDAGIRVDGDGYKYQVEITSPAFVGLSKVKRHQKVYATLSEAISSGQLHALTIIARTPDEPATPSA
ncbi:MAG: BolA/IbaG family iron-sulfur metabolism protein [Thiothrix sp.]|nr:BolA/IbaG family iron-sulfur metabolism protein [Thiothrix sp.]HPQ97323.1 BolA/IbaG family iron-sulfur metabolism protein [Thiolinea sp.]